MWTIDWKGYPLTINSAECYGQLYCRSFKVKKSSCKKIYLNLYMSSCKKIYLNLYIYWKEPEVELDQQHSLQKSSASPLSSFIYKLTEYGSLDNQPITAKQEYHCTNHLWCHKSCLLLSPMIISIKHFWGKLVNFVQTLLT